MKYTCTLFVMLLFSFIQGFGQCCVTSCEKPSRWMFGVEAGTGIGAMVADRNNLGFTNSQAGFLTNPDVDVTSGLASSVGIVARYQMGWLSLRSGISYNLRGVYLNNMPHYLDNSNGEPRVGRVGVLQEYVQIPLLLDSRLPFLSPNFRLLAGGYLGLPVGHATLSRQGKAGFGVPFIGGYKYPIDAGLQAGLSYLIPINALNSLEIKATYMYSATVRGEFYLEEALFHRVASLSAGWLFSASQAGKWFSPKAKENAEY